MAHTKPRPPGPPHPAPRLPHDSLAQLGTLDSRAWGSSVSGAGAQGRLYPFFLSRHSNTGSLGKEEEVFRNIQKDERL